jgi:hypothetical protein
MVWKAKGYSFADVVIHSRTLLFIRGRCYSFADIFGLHGEIQPEFNAKAQR